MVFHPDCENNGIFYLYPTIHGNISLVVSYEIVQVSPDIAVFTSRRLILEIAQPRTHHHSGRLTFTPDDYL